MVDFAAGALGAMTQQEPYGAEPGIGAGRAVGALPILQDSGRQGPPSAEPSAVDPAFLLQPAIAIVTITKDDQQGIRKTVASVEQQDYLRYEHVVVDGGSDVGVASWLAKWRAAMPERRILVEDPPKGIYPSMNAGIDSTTAPLVLVLNGGDELAPGSLDRVSEHYRMHGWRWAYGGVQARDREGRLQSKYSFAPFSQRILRFGLNPVPHQAAYVTRDLYREAGLYRSDLGTAADQEFFLRIAQLADPEVIPGILAIVESWGLSGEETFFGREISWHRLRQASGTAFGGQASTDLVVTALLLARMFSIRIVPKLCRIVSAFMSRLPPKREPRESASSSRRDA